MVKPQQIDMHLHTWFSDGDLSPKKVVLACKEAGKRVIAITDHDTIKGTWQAITIAKKYHIKPLLPANAEFTSVYWDKIKHRNQTEHILGYCFDPRNSKLDKFFSSQEKSKQDYAEKVVNA
jgi:predicted metal-dependent phosphoesterase TrpH